MLSLSPLANQVKRFPEIFSTLQIALMRKEMAVNVATRKCGVVYHMKEMQQVVPPNTHETVFCQNVCELVLGFDILDVDLCVQVHSVT